MTAVRIRPAFWLALALDIVAIATLTQAVLGLVGGTP